MLNHLGEGSISFSNGKPWVVSTSSGWKVCDRSGRVIERGTWPRLQPEPVVCQVNEHLVVTFQDKCSIQAKFSCEDVSRTLEVSRPLGKAR
jgi:hypothetical protein